MKDFKILNYEPLPLTESEKNAAISLKTEICKPYNPWLVNPPGTKNFRVTQDEEPEAVNPNRPHWKYVLAKDRLQYPLCTNGVLIFEYWGNDNQSHFVRASGTLIGPRHVITAAHNLYKYAKNSSCVFTHNGWASRVKFYPGVSVDDYVTDTPYSPYGEFYGTRLYASGNFIRKMDETHEPEYTEDYAMVLLHVSPGIGWMGFDDITTKDLLNTAHRMYGYPYDNSSETLISVPQEIKGKSHWNMWTDQGNANQAPGDNKTYGHNLNVWVGMSGSGLFVNRPEGPYITGIQSYHEVYNDGTGKNYAVRLNSERVELYSKWKGSESY